MAKEKKDNMIKCVHKETAKVKMLPASLFKDKSIAETLDYLPLEIKKFEEPMVSTSEEFKEQQMAKAQAMANVLEEKKRAFELEEKKSSEKSSEEKTADVFGDKRHHSTIVKEILESTDTVFVSKYLADERKVVKETAEKRILEINK